MLAEMLRGDLTVEVGEWGEEYAPRFSDEDGAPIAYQAWTAENSRVVSGPLGLHKFPGRSFPDRATARAHWLARGVIIEEYRAPGRWMFRITREYAP
jgi:hypothetical protein